MRTVLYALLISGGMLSCDCIAAQPPEQKPEQQKVVLNIAAQTMEQALSDFAAQTGFQLMFRAEEVSAALSAPRIAGSYTPRAALDLLLANTPLMYEFINDRTVRIAPARSDAQTSSYSPEGKENAGMTLAQNMDKDQRSQSSSENATESASANPRKETKDTVQEGLVAVPEILVAGARILNMDIKRSEDDAQPYVIFDRAAVERSGASSVEDFLKQKLAMNYVGISQSQIGGGAGNSSQINLRGLGANQTLVLVDGHRLSTALTSGGAPIQSDLNTIPLAAIERIEVLPTTASGIYGGSATGGVVNVILRRDFSGVETRLTYGNTFESSAASRRIDLTGGFNLASKTNVLVAGSYSDADPLQIKDRDFYQRGIANILANNPATILTAATPPVGATPNIRSTTGVNLTLKNNTPLNSPFTYIPAGYPGISAGGVAALVANAGQYNLNLADSAQATGGGNGSLLNSPTEKSLRISLRQELTANFQAFVELSGSESRGQFLVGSPSIGFTLPATATNNPFSQAIRVAVPLPQADTMLETSNTDRRAMGGVIVRLPGSWTAEADFTWDRYTNKFSGQPDPISAQARTAIGNGSLDVMRDLRVYPIDLSSAFPPPERSTPTRSTMRDFTIRLAGGIGSLPGGEPTLTLLAERREEAFSESTVFASFGDIFSPAQSQEVNSAYLEARVPVVSSANARAGVQELDLQIAGRWDDYTTNGTNNNLFPGDIVLRGGNSVHSIDPTVGLRFKPLSSVLLRASYGTGFRPPSVTEIVASAAGTTSVLDPRRGNQNATTQLFRGGNSALKPENSESLSAGVVLTPSVAPGLRVSLDYTRIEKKDGIQGLAPQLIVDNEALFPGLVTRGPVNGDPSGVGPITLVDARNTNVATSKLEAVDLAFDYQLQTSSLGSFDLFVLAARTLKYEQQLIASAPSLDMVGVQFNTPLKLKGNAGITWNRGSWSAGWAGRYFASYKVSNNTGIIQSQGQGGRVSSQHYHDLFVEWSGSPSVASKWLANTGVQIGLKNIFNVSPPFDAFASSVGYYSPFGDPSLRSYYASVRKAF